MMRNRMHVAMHCCGDVACLHPDSYSFAINEIEPCWVTGGVLEPTALMLFRICHRLYLG